MDRVGMIQDEKIWTVSGLNRELRKLIDGAMTPLWLSAELSNLTIHQSGHVYFTMKDDTSQLRAVMFNGASRARTLGLQNGMEVEAFGKIRVYEPQGQYQLYAEDIRPGGMGRLQRVFEELKKKLRDAGLFDADRKQAIPELPSCVGLITSVNGAAMRDFFKVVERRFPCLHMRIIDARMQGRDSAIQVIRALRYFNRERACDVIVITRGGGSMEDLWGFNDEELVRQIAASQIPVISAIGHETDYTLADYAADLRAPTPSAAAELVVGAKAVLRDRVLNLKRRLRAVLGLVSSGGRRRLDNSETRLLAAMHDRLIRERHRLDRLARHYLFSQPELVLQPYRQRVADIGAVLPQLVQFNYQQAAAGLMQTKNNLRLLSPARQLTHQQQRLQSVTTRLIRAVDPKIKQLGNFLDGRQAQLRALNPRSVMGRGYAILLDGKSGSAVRHAGQVAAGDCLRGILAVGELELEVKTAKEASPD